jgi:hypothetical protein
MAVSLLCLPLQFARRTRGFYWGGGDHESDQGSSQDRDIGEMFSNFRASRTLGGGGSEALLMPQGAQGHPSLSPKKMRST